MAGGSAGRLEGFGVTSAVALVRRKRCTPLLDRDERKEGRSSLRRFSGVRRVIVASKPSILRPCRQTSAKCRVGLACISHRTLRVALWRRLFSLPRRLSSRRMDREPLQQHVSAGVPRRQPKRLRHEQLAQCRLKGDEKSGLAARGILRRICRIGAGRKLRDLPRFFCAPIWAAPPPRRPKAAAGTGVSGHDIAGRLDHGR